MVTRLDGSRKRTRHKMSKPLRRKGKLSLTKYFQDFKAGDKVALKAEPAYHKGLYPMKFHGKICMIKGRRGKCYELIAKDGGKTKMLLVHSVHLKKV